MSSRRPAETSSVGLQPAAARVTVCVPTRNRAALLRQTIESVLSQTYPDFRLLISDNASTDGTRALIASYGDRRLKYARSESDLGPVANLNRCLSEISTDYGIVLCDDDLLRPDHLETMVPLLDAHPGVGLAYAACDLIGADGALLEPDARWNGLSAHKVEPGDEFIRRGIEAGHSRMDMSTALMRRSAIPTDGFDPVDLAACDVGLSLRLALNWDVAFVDRTLGATRVHDETFSAEHGELRNGHHVLGPELIARTRELKLELLRDNESRFPDRRRLRRQARRAARSELLVRTWALTVPERRRAPTIRLLGEAVRTEAAVALWPAFWRLLAASLMGPTLVSHLRRMARRGGEDASHPSKDQLLS